MSFKKIGDPKEIFPIDKVEVCSLLVGSIFKVSEKHSYFCALEKDVDFEGAPFEVNFDYKKVYELEDAGFSVIGFVHTHPFQEDVAAYSSIDNITMSAWCSSLGRNLLCIIENAKALPEIFIFSKHGFMKTGKIYRWDFANLDNGSVARLLIGSFSNES